MVRIEDRPSLFPSPLDTTSSALLGKYFFLNFNEIRGAGVQTLLKKASKIFTRANSVTQTLAVFQMGQVFVTVIGLKHKGHMCLLCNTFVT